MKICRFEAGGDTFAGVLEDDRVTVFENNRRKNESYALADIKLVEPLHM